MTKNWMGIAIGVFILGILVGVVLSVIGAPDLLVRLGVVITWLAGAAIVVYQLFTGSRSS